MTQRALGLTDEQFNAVLTAARQVPPRSRHSFLQTVTDEIEGVTGHDVSDVELNTAIGFALSKLGAPA